MRPLNGLMKRVFFSMAVAFVLAACSSGATAEKISQIKPAMKVDEVEAILGRPDHIDQSETTGLQGQVYYYNGSRGQGRVVFLNDAVFKADFVPGGKA